MINGIMVYAKTNGTLQFIGTYDDIETLETDVYIDLGSNNRIDLTEHTYFMLNGVEYKLFLETGKDVE